MENTFKLNYYSTVITSQIVGRIFAMNNKGIIINISSIAGLLPLTRAISYSDSKAACISFTKWLAVHIAINYSPNIRVNSIAPGFILTDQNKFLLIDENTGKMTERGKNILKNVPMKRYGFPHEIVSAAIWLSSDLSSFITGTVITIDGGFTAFSGV